MLRRIIPYLEVSGDELITGDDSSYKQSDAVELARFYESAGADEIMIFEHSERSDRNDKMLSLIERLTEEVFIPLTLAGGIDSISKIKQFLRAGASKVCINSHALKSPDFLKDAADKIGPQNMVLSFYYRQNDEGYKVFSKTGKAPYQDVLKWAKFAEELVTGIIAQQITDGQPSECVDLNVAELLSENVSVPVLISFGQFNSTIDDFLNAFQQTKISGIIAYNVFHHKERSIKKIKKLLQTNKLVVRQGSECITSRMGRQTGQIEINLLEENPQVDIELMNKIKEAKEKEDAE